MTINEKRDMTKMEENKEIIKQGKKRKDILRKIMETR